MFEDLFGFMEDALEEDFYLTGLDGVILFDGVCVEVLLADLAVSSPFVAVVHQSHVRVPFDAVGQASQKSTSPKKKKGNKKKNIQSNDGDLWTIVVKLRSPL